MKIKDRKLIDEINKNLELIEEELRDLGVQDKPLEPKIRFPRGFIRKTREYQEKYPCKMKRIRKNVAYTLQFRDVLRWLLIRTDIGLSAKEMIIKYGIISAFSVIEAIIWETLRINGLNPGKKFIKNIEKLLNNKLIDKTLYDDLETVHNKREKIHIELYILTGDDNYIQKDWDFSLDVLVRLRDALLIKKK